TADEQGPLEAGREQAGIEVLRNRHGLEEPFDLAVFGDVDDAILHRRRRYAVADGTSMELDFAAAQEIALIDAGDDLESLGAAGPDQPEYPGDLAVIDRE